ncbi:TetR family transcriptional regulator [Arthrobacter sp. Soil761]|uniref:TetR family transcriptional regulator n=1 Tax=Arthrobacter sp. Soil761 TaxID=1736400 RepID=UPI00138F2554
MPFRLCRGVPAKGWKGEQPQPRFNGQLRRAVLRAHGYRLITVGDISAGAGVSPALVMKLFHSTEKLFSAAGPMGRSLPS